MQPIRRPVTYILALLAAVPLSATYGEDKWITDPQQISEVLHSMPAVGGDVGSRLKAAGLTVTSIGMGRITKDDVADDPGTWALGDVEVQVLTDGEPQTGGCQVLGSPTFIKRHGRYLPQDRTGVWLTTGRCALPN